MSEVMLLLHSHIPYVKRQGRWPFGEVWLFEAMAETYIPLLNMLSRLSADNVNTRLALSFSPTLLDQLDSKYIRHEFIEYLREREMRAGEEQRHYSSLGESALSSLAAYYQRYYRDIRMSYQADYGMDLLQAYNDLQNRGIIEIIATAATHAYLPLIDPTSMKYQIHLGKIAYEKHFKSQPKGFWLPECGYKNGMEDALIDHGFRYFFVDSHAVEGGKPLGDSSHRTLELPVEVEFFADTGLSTYRPYLIKNKDVMVFGRNAMVSQQVWSADFGYPGDENYREYHMRSPRSGLKLWRVTNRSGLGSKQLYDPESAISRSREHAWHFVASIDNTIKQARKIGVDEPIIVACYDTELFGHWWWEGPMWLEQVIRLMSRHPDLELCLPGAISPPSRDAQLFESSWGMGGKHFIWNNDETVWMWELTREVCDNFLAMLKNDPTCELEARAMTQALKELLLLESSDWFFMVSNNLTRDYAMKRFFEHYTRFLRLVETINEKAYTRSFQEWLAQAEYEDDFLPDLPYDQVRII